MSKDSYKTLFLKAAQEWICDGYSVDTHYFVRKECDNSYLWASSIEVYPLPASWDLTFHTETFSLYLGHEHNGNQSKLKLIQLLEKATEGQVDAKGLLFNSTKFRPSDYYSTICNNDRWEFDLNLQVTGNQLTPLGPTEVMTIDNELRLSDPPFDGLADAASQLGLGNFHSWSTSPFINIRLLPPVDLILPECNLQNDLFRLVLHAHPLFDLNRISLAIRVVPTKGVHSRRQVGSEIKWGRIHKDRREGIAEIRVHPSHSVLAILMIGGYPVRRHWFVDSAKSPHDRLIAIQHFDGELRMIKKAVLESVDSGRFEKGIAALLFLLGFTPVLQLESDSPDIVVATPSGRLLIVECTIKIADFGVKLGKLVDRRASLVKALQVSMHYSRVDAALVCALPKDQIAMRADDVIAHKVILVTKEELMLAFDQVRFPSNPDEMIDTAFTKLHGELKVGNG